MSKVDIFGFPVKKKKTKWLPIETAPKFDEHGDPVFILLGFAPDEENYSLPTREGWWHSGWNWWVTSIDPDNPHNPPQPTHWRKMPKPPV